MPKCYTKKRNDGSNYTTCNKNITENQSKSKSKPKMKKEDEVRPVDKNIPTIKPKTYKKWEDYEVNQKLMSKWKNWSKKEQAIFRSNSINNKNIGRYKNEDMIKELKDGDNYNDKRIKEYIKAVDSAVAVAPKYQSVGDRMVIIGQTFYMANGKTKKYFPNARKNKK